MSTPRNDPLTKFFGCALMAVGGLIAALCGTCSLAMFGTAALSAFRYPGQLLGMGAMVAVVGGLPTLAGLLIVRWGWRLYRPRPKVPVEVFGDAPDPGPK